MDQLAVAAELDFQRGLTALNARHLKHVVDQGEQKTAGGLDFCNVVDREVLLVDVLFQQIRETDDGIHRGSDVVAHVEQKTCFCFVGRLRFLYGFFQFFCVNLVFIAAHLELQKTNRGKQGKDEPECKGNKNLQRTEPAVFRCNFKMPGVVRHGAENFHGIGTPGIAGVCDGNVFAGGRRNFPEFVGVAGFFQCIQFNFVQKRFPVENENRKAPEGLATIGIGGINRVKEQCSDVALLQLKRSCNRVFAALFGKACLLFPGRMLEHVKSECGFVSTHRINQCDNAVLCKLMCFDDILVVLHQRGEDGKLFVIDGITGFNHVFHQIGFGKIMV